MHFGHILVLPVEDGGITRGFCICVSLHVGSDLGVHGWHICAAGTWHRANVNEVVDQELKMEIYWFILLDKYHDFDNKNIVLVLYYISRLQDKKGHFTSNSRFDTIRMPAMSFHLIRIEAWHCGWWHHLSKRKKSDCIYFWKEERQKGTQKQLPFSPMCL